MKKRLFGILLSFAMMMVMLPALGVSQTAYADNEVTYLNEYGETKTVPVDGFITSGTTALTEGWYAVNDNVDLDGLLSLTGNVNIILCDNKKLTVSNTSGDGITNSGVLTIYAQSKGSAMGKLDVTGNNGIENGKDLEVVGGDVKATGNAAGGCAIRANRDVKISGGSVTASGSTAIRAVRNVEIKGGTVTATATGDNGNAISASHYVDLMGGSVTASGAGMGRGIDVNNNVQLGGSVRVWAGSSASDAADVTATFANNHGQKWVQTETATLWVGGIPVTSRNAENILGDAGATASYDYSTETLKLNNYSYEIEGHKFGALDNFYAAIYADQDLTIRLVGKNTVKCTEKEESVGFGIYSNGKAITISGSGTLIAAGYGQSGIGIQTDNADITINGGTVTASGDNGLSANGGSVVINDGIVTAIGSSNDLGISADSIVVADKMGINAGDSKETAVGVDKKTFIEKHPQHWVQISEAYPLWVRGTLVMVANRDDVLADGKVSYDPDTHTLTLNGPNITADNEKQYNYSAIHYGDEENELIIDATKDSTVTGPNYDDPKEKTSYGISSESLVTVHGKLTAEGRKASSSFGVFAPAFVVEDKAEAKVRGDSGGVYISEGTDACIIVSGKLTAAGDDYGIYFYPGSTGIVTVNSGAELTATGGVMGIVPNSDNGYVEIKKGAKVRAVGGKYGFHNSAIEGIVKNAVPGLGWTNPEGTEGKTYFDINTQPGQKPGDDIKCAEFPAPEASVAKAPTAKSLKYTGSAQELVTAGEAKDGTMQYAIGKDATTAPTEGWSTSIPKGTDAGDYYVWYKAVGDATHSDSEPVCVKVPIAGKPAPTPAAAPVSNYVRNNHVTAGMVKAVSDAGYTEIVLGRGTKKIDKAAFAGTNIRTVYIRSKKLTKKGVKNSLKGSSVTKIRVNVKGSKSADKKYVKKYKKIFTKKNCGRKVTVKRCSDAQLKAAA